MGDSEYHYKLEEDSSEEYPREKVGRESCSRLLRDSVKKREKVGDGDEFNVEHQQERGFFLGAVYR